MQIAIDALVMADVLPFWQAILGYDFVELTGDSLVDPKHIGPTVWFQQMDAPRPQRNRIHVDLYVPHEQAEGRIAAAIEAGGPSCTTGTRRCGGPSPIRKATRSTSHPGRISTSLKRADRSHRPRMDRSSSRRPRPAHNRTPNARLQLLCGPKGIRTPDLLAARQNRAIR